ncbi:hypothetical protein SAMN04487995_3822 [Dyadobacter koreensis]|uniref:Uncharacterized protein n=1 Tax=Dyadobacter koreensis TaxID=408657 RepID=A0A1H6XMH6_9BACT|nr:hypothetical protein SAMN04487995_3822 [Dyadobacter koreensis]
MKNVSYFNDYNHDPIENPKHNTKERPHLTLGLLKEYSSSTSFL